MKRGGRGTTRRRWHRSALAGMTLIGAAGLLAGCGPAQTAVAPHTTRPVAAASPSASADGPGEPTVTTPAGTPRATPSTTSRPATSHRATPRSTGGTAPRRTTARPALGKAGVAAPGTALSAVGLLVVKGRAPMTGYDRAKFGPAWSDIDRNGCDQRNDVLRRDLVGITIKAGTRGCKVMSGTLHDPYTGMTISFRHSSRSFSPVQIDHVVALGDAWAMGAWRWSTEQREQLANDPLDLLAVDAHTNMSKGDGDAATWLPPNKADRCAYIARQVAVKTKYHLAVTSAERAAMTRVLDTCPAQRMPTSSVIPLGGGRIVVPSQPRAPRYVPPPRHSAPPAPPARPAPPRRTSTPPKPPSSRTIVHPGAFCAPVGARGFTSKGTPMVCSVKAGQDRARWRSAS